MCALHPPREQGGLTARQDKEYPGYYRTLYKKPDLNSAIDPNEADWIYESGSENLERTP